MNRRTSASLSVLRKCSEGMMLLRSTGNVDKMHSIYAKNREDSPEKSSWKLHLFCENRCSCFGWMLLWSRLIEGKHRRCRSKKMLWLATCIFSDIGISFSLEWAFEKKTSHHLKINQKTHNLMSRRHAMEGRQIWCQEPIELLSGSAHPSYSPHHLT